MPNCQCKDCGKSFAYRPADVRTEPRCHQIFVGDSTDPACVQRLLGREKPFLMVTDPPYGVDYDPAWRQESAEAGHLAYAARRIGEVANDDRADWREAWRLFPGDVVYCWHAGKHASKVQASIEAAGFEIRSHLIWSKPHFPISRGHYHWRHEPCWYAIRQGSQAFWCGGHEQTTVWEITLDRNAVGGHGTQKPVECMARPIRNHGRKGDIVYDPFLGSGTTLVAAEQEARIAYGCEIEPKYVAAALERLAGMGLEPRLENRYS
jgi:DNA modification methylase